MLDGTIIMPLVNFAGESPMTATARILDWLGEDLVESDRLVRFLRVATYAEEIFEERDRAIAWLKSPNRALGGQAPLELLDTDAGSEQVVEILTRIDYGVYS